MRRLVLAKKFEEAAVLEDMESPRALDEHLRSPTKHASALSVQLEDAKARADFSSNPFDPFLV